MVIPRSDRNSSMTFCLKYSNQIFPIQAYLPLLSILNCLVNGDNSKIKLKGKGRDSNGL